MQRCGCGPTLRNSGPPRAALAGLSLFATSPVLAADTAAPQKTLHGMKAESVDDRIADLHKSLKITADEETNWAGIAKVISVIQAQEKHRRKKQLPLAS